MLIKTDFELVNIADDYMLVPVGDQIEQFNGTIVLNEVSAFIIEKLKTERTKEELINLLLDEFDVDSKTAQTDVDIAVEKMVEIGILDE